MPTTWTPNLALMFLALALLTGMMKKWQQQQVGLQVYQ